MSKEIWKRVPGHAPYEASSYGRVRNPFRRKGKPLSGSILPNGYHHLVISGNRGAYVHRFVCLAFNGKRPKNMECCHLNGNKTDNRPNNLMWGTRKVNESHKKIHGTSPEGEKNGAAKLTQKQVNKIRKSYNGSRGEITQLAKIYGVHQPAISRILLGQRWSYLWQN